MKILAFDVATTGCSIALVDTFKEFRILSERSLSTSQGQASFLIPLIDECLKSADSLITDVAAIATTIGPGSFTGLRVGLAAAKGFQIALGLPLWGVTTFETLAFDAIWQGLTQKGQAILVLLESGRQDFYAQLFTAEGVALGQGQCMFPLEVASCLEMTQAVVVGTGVERFRVLEGSDKYITHPLKIRAATIVQAALALGRTDLEAATPDGMVPYYLKAPDVSLPKIRF